MTREGNLYRADEGLVLVRRSDGFVMGDALDLGVADSIDNYEERSLTEEELSAYMASTGAGEGAE